MVRTKQKSVYKTRILYKKAQISDILNKLNVYLENEFFYIRTSSLHNKYQIEFRHIKNPKIHLIIIQTLRGVEIEIHEDKFIHYSVYNKTSMAIFRKISRVLSKK
ncbi:MAG: hypothetical protein ACTSRP_19135 [Candidatus Helarchaeota archaeon]